MSLRLLCRLADIPDGGGKGFWFGADTARFGVFLIRRGSEIYAYENSCPHRGTPLDWRPDRFLDRDGSHILCATHGALFRIDDGFCLSGPCVGASLRRVAITLRGGVLYLAENAPPS
ncbi:MAG TPA: Rieske (2Fe-2S) protein [Stellaceae bacterium]|nr:Rieske (2Fe-2S) protein [Stellaceae bacterium]